MVILLIMQRGWRMDHLVIINSFFSLSYDYNSFYSSPALLLRLALRNITAIKNPLEALAQKVYFRS